MTQPDWASDLAAIAEADEVKKKLGIDIPLADRIRKLLDNQFQYATAGDTKALLTRIVELEELNRSAYAEGERAGMERAGNNEALAEAAQQYIIELRNKIEFFKTAGIVEIAIRNPNVDSYVKHWEGRALKAEAAIRAAKETKEPPSPS